MSSDPTLPLSLPFLLLPFRQIQFQNPRFTRHQVTLHILAGQLGNGEITMTTTASTTMNS